MAITFKFRRGTASTWTSNNPTLAAGEIGFETDTRKVKIGDGSTAWSSLGYIVVTDPAAVAKSTVTTKGDLIAATASATVDRLAAGADGYSLFADPAATTGLSWQPQFVAGKNAIINGAFEINQRAFTSTTTTGTFGFDRWFLICSGGTVTYSTQTFTPGTAPVVGYEGTNFAQLVSASQSAASDRAFISQRVENVRTFANQTVTVSFWAKAASGTPNVAVNFTQVFGTSGSAAVEINGQKTAISTSWARYSFTFTLNSVAGKTITSDSYLQFRIWTSGGSDVNTQTATMGVQNATIDIWGVQLEAGSVATPFSRAAGTLQGELAACQRYYWRAVAGSAYGNVSNHGSAATTSIAYISVPLRVTMRAAISSVEYANLAMDDSNATVGTISAITVTQTNPEYANVRVAMTSTDLTAYRPYKLSGNNNAAGYLAFSAEL